eukprot:TRINITY_DN45944_c0_g1_i1.p1 TRINITY_DN45944_c0_g1~~TRINITY_DN45944_c0_g1_i1.p1  ORF type:complete len:286 (+),score=115.85 TRINITY_DN45944_c0_g1_i1:384-1241(+)
MVDTMDLEAEIREELRLLQVQVEHSRRQRKKREQEREKEKAAAAAAAASLAASVASREGLDTLSVASGDTLTSTAQSTTATSTAGQITLKKKKQALQKDSADMSEAPAGAADVKRQRVLEAQKRKETQEAEDSARKEAQKSSAAQEKGGWVEAMEKAALRGWNAKKYFAVVRGSGFYLYSKEVQGRGSTRGAITYDSQAKHSVFVPFEVEAQNSRGSSKIHKANVSASLSNDDHASVAKAGANPFGINFYHEKDKTFDWKVVCCASAKERDDWVAFIAKFVKERK